MEEWLLAVEKEAGTPSFDRRGPDHHLCTARLQTFVFSATLTLDPRAQRPRPERGEVGTNTQFLEPP